MNHFSTLSRFCRLPLAVGTWDARHALPPVGPQGHALARPNGSRPFISDPRSRKHDTSMLGPMHGCLGRRSFLGPQCRGTGVSVMARYCIRPIPSTIGYSRGYSFQPLDVLMAVYTMLNVADEKSIYEISPPLTRGIAYVNQAYHGRPSCIVRSCSRGVN